MKAAGRKTASTQSMAKSRGTVVSCVPCQTARARLSDLAACVWIFSTATVASSTRIPTASANPPSVIRLSVWPVSHNATKAAKSAKGMFNTTTITLRQSRRNKSTINPVRMAPSAPSLATPFHRPRDVRRLIELETQLDLLGKHGLHLGHGFLHPVHDGQRRRVGPFAHQHVDGPAAVDQREAGGNVGAVLNPAGRCHHVADVHVAPGRSGILPRSWGSTTIALVGTICR